MVRRSIAWLLVGTTVMPALAPLASARGHRHSGGRFTDHPRSHYGPDGYHNSGGDGDGWGELVLGLTVFALNSLFAPRPRAARFRAPRPYAPPPPPCATPPMPQMPVLVAPPTQPGSAPPVPANVPAPACTAHPVPADRPLPTVQPACIFEDVETPIFEERTIPVYEDRTVPVTEMVVSPIVARRPDQTGRMHDVVIGERRTPTLVGTRVERLKVGERCVAVRTGTRVERRIVGAVLSPAR